MSDSGGLWRQICGYPRYEINADGVVRLLCGRAAGRVIKSETLMSGRRSYRLWTGTQYKRHNAARLVALAFFGQPQSRELQAAHNDGTKTNDVRENIRWATPQENQDDRRRHGTRCDGQRNPAAILTPDQVSEIRLLYPSNVTQGQRGHGITLKSLAKKYGVSHTQIWRVVRELSWGT
jgi:hypothetical protein